MNTRKYNKVLEKFSDGSVLIDISTPKHPNATSMMDADSFSEINAKWRIRMNSRGYPVVKVGGNSVPVHKLLFPLWKEVDHVSRDKSDNRRVNLRECSHSQNCCNRIPLSRNTSGTIGVHWYKRRGLWGAYISIKRKRIHLGYFANKDKAVAAREKAESKLFGKFAPSIEGS